MSLREKQFSIGDKQFLAAELISDRKVALIVEVGLVRRITSVKFVPEEFTSWLDERAGKTTELEPLLIALLHDNPPNTKRGITQAEFLPLEGGSLIRLYLEEFFEDFDMPPGKLSHEDRKRIFNNRLNLHLVHELAHWIQYLKGEPLWFKNVVIKIKKQFDEDLNNMGEQAATQLALNRLEEANEQFKNMPDHDHASYAQQPHEIAAREASREYPKKHGHMIWCELAENAT
jgi:hypothetical protein